MTKLLVVMCSLLTASMAIAQWTSANRAHAWMRTGRYPHIV